MNSIDKLLKQNIILIDKSHEYVLKAYPELEFSSVTRCIDKHFKPFDKWRIARILTSNNPKYDHLTAKQLVKEWDKKKNHGNKVHNELERFIKEKINPKKKASRNGVKAIKEISEKFGNNFFSEVIVFSKALSVAGTVDLIVKGDNDSFYIFDWKTTKDIYKDNGRYGISDFTEHLKDSNFNKYSLQLSAYNYLLREFHDINVSGQFIVHLTEFGYEIIEADYHDSIIEGLLMYSFDEQDEQDNQNEDLYEYNFKRQDYIDNKVRITETEYALDNDLSNIDDFESDNDSEQPSYVYKDYSNLYTILGCLGVGTALALYFSEIGLGIGVSLYLYIIIRTS